MLGCRDASSSRLSAVLRRVDLIAEMMPHPVANSFLLFWLSLIPAATAWMGENFLVPIPTAFYGGILLMPAIAYYLLQKSILRKQGSES
jgi:uncharacterized membrane protein